MVLFMDLADAHNKALTQKTTFNEVPAKRNKIERHSETSNWASKATRERKTKGPSRRIPARPVRPLGVVGGGGMSGREGDELLEWAKRKGYTHL